MSEVLGYSLEFCSAFLEEFKKEKYRHLYDVKHVSYRNKKKKAQTWTELDQAIAMEGSCKLWKALRDKYSKEKKRLERPTGSGLLDGPTMSDWPLFNDMNFLDSLIMCRSVRYVPICVVSVCSFVFSIVSVFLLVYNVVSVGSAIYQ